ncbi:hypothetical protein FRACYDRAFT_179618 [Fragilariopsis cylindrus CCMP1102]|uniref:Uncharacterized protein n=1 Tax=Fragilariopsis cylindrus CCMP1102 TaxID=635003 RepID=A0A1E7FXJ6_9STRA|nr:hypothetical protein FRACYDRAFT_179618 [Fragilariopsis cylindrus CCMP1102]|eukprot:OEU22870.1 hypothetical protein FRACYDRAFT_179618 [Fragilariopsis cylindrus CCMP1102]
MPPTPKNNTKPQKKKGRTPAHQNQFAWTHNPKSKTTERILASPIMHVCKRCNEKLEWRKQYRKYKPRTQPGMCNGCKKRNVKSAYHTICGSCTTESVSFETTKTAKSTSITEKEEILRVCAVCVKEVALPDPVEEGDDADYIDAMSKLKLREKRALERKIVKQEEEAAAAAKNNKNKNPSKSAGDDNDSKIEDGEGKNFEDDDNSDDGYDDPFLKAIGGSILTGEAYQKKLLEHHQQEKQSGRNTSM